MLNKIADADHIARRFRLGGMNAVEAELALLDLGFTHITFPKRGALIECRYLGVAYVFEGEVA